MSIIHPDEALPLCSATVDLLSRLQRPFIWGVTVRGLPPHAHTRRYEIQASCEKDAAQAAIDRFVREFSKPLTILHALDR